MEKALPYAVRSTVRPKRVARLLRAALAARGVDRPHVACLDIVARMYGHPDFATLERHAPHREASLDDALVDSAEVAARRAAQVAALVASGIDGDLATSVVDEIRPSGRAATPPVEKVADARQGPGDPPAVEALSRDGRRPWWTAYDTTPGPGDAVPAGGDGGTGARVAIHLRDGDGQGGIVATWLGTSGDGQPPGGRGRDDPASVLEDYSTLLRRVVTRAEEAVLGTYAGLVNDGDAGEDEDLVQTAAADALRTVLEGSMLVLSSHRLHDIHDHLQEHLDGRLARLEREAGKARGLVPELRRACETRATEGWQGIVRDVLEAGVSYRDILGVASCSKSTVARWADGHTAPGPHARAALCGRFADLLEAHAHRADFLLGHLAGR